VAFGCRSRVRVHWSVWSLGALERVGSAGGKTESKDAQDALLAPLSGHGRGLGHGKELEDWVQ
jgi:hypothetical protein